MIMNAALHRREMLRQSVALAALALLRHPLSAFGLDEPAPDEELIPFLDVQPVGKMLRWEQLTNWVTSNDQVFSVSHYNTPELDLNTWQLEISGLVNDPKTL